MRLAKGTFQRTTRQAKEYLLCAGCESLFNSNGEDWTLRNLYRGRGVFRLRDMVTASPALWTDGNFSIYSAATLPAGSVDQLTYFCASIFWRAAIRDWHVEDKDYEALSLGPYREELREYLLGRTGFPHCAAVYVVLSQLQRPVIAFNFPESKRGDNCYWHLLHVPGVTFVLAVGKMLSDQEKGFCITRSPLHLIYQSKDGDARVQRSFLTAMGKFPTTFGDYPLTEGVV